MNAIRRAGVCGWPIAHSRSPLIHGYWLKRYGINGAYERFGVPPLAFAEFVASVGADGFVGFNVTVPHKETAYAACEKLSEAAQATGAVNTLWRDGAALSGDNTDVEGFLGSLDAEAPGWRDRVFRATVLGAGGAARAVVYGLKMRGVEEIVIVNRTKARAEALVARFGPTTRATAWGKLSAELPQTDLLINTTTLGMVGQPPLDFDLAPLKAKATVADIVYTPLATRLLEAARKRNLVTVGGLGMLLRQAAPGFALWFGRTPEITKELRKLAEADLRAGGSGR
ncbi:MAG: shikimate dehydrogenase [Bradyrhizobium sp.]|nr:MAG: shikimate dehydrogenase [Bradyrhizobium sp.]